MVERIKDEWRIFVAAPPGSRFARRYAHQREGAPNLLGRLAWIGAGVFFLLAGFVMLFTPGPGLLAMGFGATCLAQESLGVARFCDRCETRIRQAWEWWKRRG